MTSLIDVVFLLLIFFMVSTTFEHQAVLKVDLPEAKNVSAPEDQPNSFELVIDPKGLFFLNDRQLVDGKRATLVAAFLEAAGEDRNVPVILRAVSPACQLPLNKLQKKNNASATSSFNRGCRL